jgi:hypothetical protein
MTVFPFKPGDVIVPIGAPTIEAPWVPTPSSVRGWSSVCWIILEVIPVKKIAWMSAFSIKVLTEDGLVLEVHNFRSVEWKKLNLET